MIVYLARDIQAFVMYCVNGTSGSSLLIESTDSMITSRTASHCAASSSLHPFNLATLSEVIEPLVKGSLSRIQFRGDYRSAGHKTVDFSRCKRDLRPPAIWGPRHKNAGDVRIPLGPISLAVQGSRQRRGDP